MINKEKAFFFAKQLSAAHDKITRPQQTRQELNKQLKVVKKAKPRDLGEELVKLEDLMTQCLALEENIMKKESDDV